MDKIVLYAASYSDVVIADYVVFAGEYFLSIPSSRGTYSPLAKRALIMSHVGQIVKDLLQKWEISELTPTIRCEERVGDTLPTTIKRVFTCLRNGIPYVITQLIHIQPDLRVRVCMWGQRSDK